QPGGQRRATGGRHGGAPAVAAVDGGFPATGMVIGGGAPVAGRHQPPFTI
ncbi:hypothetical protein A2U01_0072439, partial [Trifolium medium]|nr:hypothetical protein [Trifolium medium]